MSRATARANQDRAELGIVLMLVAYLGFALVDTSVKWLVLAGVHALQLAFIRYAGAFAISLVGLLRGGLDRDSFRSDRLGLLLLRSAFLLSSTVSNFIVLKYLPLTVTSAIMFSAPVIVCALSMPLLGERVGAWRWGAIFLGFAGVLVVIRPFGQEFTWWALLPLYNAFAMAMYSILTRKLSGVVPIETMQLYIGLTGTIAMLPLAAVTWTNPTTALDWALMLGLGPLAWVGHELLTRAHGIGSSSTLMPYTYSFMLYLMVTGYLVFGDVPDAFTLVGALIIVVSGLVIWLRERGRSTTQTKPQG